MMTKILFIFLVFGLTALTAPALAGGKAAVVVVDIQADFTTAHNGSLAVNGTDDAYLKQAAEATESLKGAGLAVYATQDWHPADHMSFAANHEGKKPFETIKLDDGRVQVLWPNHCVQETGGAKVLFDAGLFTAVVRKGMDAKFDSYSGFKDDGGAATELDKTLKAAGVETIIVYGIATDYCVQATVLDGLAAGYKVVVVQDLCRGVDPKTSEEAWAKMKEAGAVLWPKLDLEQVKSL